MSRMVVLWGQKLGRVSEREMDRVAHWIGLDLGDAHNCAGWGKVSGSSVYDAQSLIVDRFF